MDVAGPADRGRVAQHPGDLLDAGGDDALLGALVLGGAGLGQGLGAVQRTRPGAEVLGGEGSPRGFADVVVDVVGVDGVPLALVVEVLEQALARQLLAAADQRREAPVVDAGAVLLAALAAEVEHRRRPGEANHVPLAEGGEAEALVGLGVLVVADADGRLLHDPHDRRQHLLARKSALGEVRLDPLAQAGEGASEFGHAAVLGLVPVGAPIGMIDVLLAALLVAAGRLDVAAGFGADPDLGPGRRNHQLGDAILGAGVLDRLAVSVDVGESLARPLAADARVAVVHIDQSDGGGLLGSLQHIGRHDGSPRRPRRRFGT